MPLPGNISSMMGGFDKNMLLQIFLMQQMQKQQQAQQQKPSGAGKGLGKLVGKGVKGSGLGASLGLGGGSTAASTGATAVGSATTASGAPGILMSDGTIVAASKGSGLGGLAAGFAPYAGVAAGGLLLGKGVKDLFNGSSGKGLEGKAGRATLGIATGGLSEIARLAGLGDHESTEDERKRRFKALQDKGVRMHQSAPDAPTKSKDGYYNYDDSQAEDFVGLTENGKWTNNAFAKSRDVKDLKAEDIWGHSSFYEQYGNDWLEKFSEDERRNIAQAYLDQGRVSEGRGQIELSGDRINPEDLLMQQVAEATKPQVEQKVELMPVSRSPQGIENFQHSGGSDANTNLGQTSTSLVQPQIPQIMPQVAPQAIAPEEVDDETANAVANFLHHYRG